MHFRESKFCFLFIQISPKFVTESQIGNGKARELIFDVLYPILTQTVLNFSGKIWSKFTSLHLLHTEASHFWYPLFYE